MRLKALLTPATRESGTGRARLVLGLALAATLAAVALVPESGGEVVETTRPMETTRPADARQADVNATAAPPGPALALDKLKRAAAGPGKADLFASTSWYVPPPPPPPRPAPPPPPPSAPPLPFTYLGQLREAPGQDVVFLVKGDRLYTVTAGDVIDGTYRVDGISAGRLKLTYLPLDIPQFLALGDLS